MENKDKLEFYELCLKINVLAKAHPEYMIAELLKAVYQSPKFEQELPEIIKLTKSQTIPLLYNRASEKEKIEFNKIKNLPCVVVDSISPDELEKD